MRLKEPALPSEEKAEPGGQALARVRTSYFGGGVLVRTEMAYHHKLKSS